MRNLKLLIPVLFTIVIVFLSGIAFSQKSVKASHTLTWKPDIISTFGENESVKLLNFDGAVYDGTLHALPWFTELLNYEYSGYQPVVTLENPIYEPFTTGAEIDPAKLGSEAEVKASVMVERKTNKLGISVLPFRKNPNTQALERLVSFNINISAGAPEPRKSYSRQRIFCSKFGARFRNLEENFRFGRWNL